MDVLIPAVGAVATAAIAALATYLSMRWAKSGQIKSTEADVLWREAGTIRRDLWEQIQKLEQHIEANEGQIAELRLKNAELKEEVMRLRTENAQLTREVEALREENVALRTRQQKQDTRMEEATT